MRFNIALGLGYLGVAIFCVCQITGWSLWIAAPFYFIGVGVCLFDMVPTIIAVINFYRHIFLP